MNKSNFSVINSILAVVYMKLLIASIVNTQNSELLKSSNFGSNGNLSTGDQISIIIGLIGLLGAFVIYIMLVVTLFSHVPWIFNFGKKVKGIENILRRK